MKQKRLDRIEKKLGEELPRVGIIFSPDFLTSPYQNTMRMFI